MFCLSRKPLSFVALLPLALSACSGERTAPQSPPAKAEPVAHELELLRLTLTPEAQQRLGIATVRVGEGSAAASREGAGEIVVPPTTASGVPTGSLTNLQQLGAQQATADGAVAQAIAQVRLARLALTRAEALVREEAGSVRARDEAVAGLAVAKAALTMARQQRRLLGPPVSAMGSQSVLWVRVSVSGSDVAAIQRSAAATMWPLGEAGTARMGRPVNAPPSANSAAGTVDLYYALDNRDRSYRVGQRVAVALPLGGEIQGLSVPSSAIVRDIHGGEWVYRKTGKGQFLRQHVEVASERRGQALLSRGIPLGAEIVTAGTAELFGTEFGAAH